MGFICIFAHVSRFSGWLSNLNKKKSGSGSSVSATKPKPHFMIYFPKGTHYIWCNVCTTVNVITMTTQCMTTITVMFLRCNRNAVHSSSHHCDVYISITLHYIPLLHAVLAEMYILCVLYTFAFTIVDQNSQQYFIYAFTLFTVLLNYSGRLCSVGIKKVQMYMNWYQVKLNKSVCFMAIME